MANIDFALSYAARGWRVMPVFTVVDGACSCRNPRCISPGKHPMVPDWDVNATADLKQVKEWWTQRPEANIAIATGRASGIWSLDVDGKEGKKSMVKVIVEFGDLPITYWWKTGGGGRQVFFSWPTDGKEVRNRVGIFPNVDVRGESGYVVAPPSKHISGNIYETPCPINLAVAVAPPWLLETATSRPEITLVPGNGGLLISNGNRNMELFTMGARLRETFPGINSEVVRAFLDAVNKNHLSEPLNAAEILALTKNLWKYQR